MFENVSNCGVGKFVSSGQWRHPDRIIDSYAIIFIIKGEVFINEAGVEYQLTKGEILILHPHVRHYGYQASTNTEYFWLHWRGGPEVPAEMKYRKIENPYNITLYLRQLLEARVMHKHHEGLDYLTRLILIELYANSKQPTVNYIAEETAALIKANCHTKITEMEIATKLGYNADYLNRMFKATFSKTVKQYIDEKRMEYIKSLMLNENLPLQKVADKAGFTEYKYFLKFFKYHEKITPTEFYKLYAKMHINSH